MSGTDDLEAKRQHLKQLLDRLRQAQDIVPLVQTLLELADWELQALSNRPSEADEVPSHTLARRFRAERSYLESVLPMVPEYDRDAIEVFTAANTSGTSDVYTYVARVGDLGTFAAQEYSRTHMAAYRELQTAQSRPERVRELIVRLGNPQTAARFDRARSAYLDVRSSTGGRTAAALEMRNLLDGLQGDLYAKARGWPSENMAWEKMANRLARADAEGVARQELVGQKSTRASLICRLSDVLKDREGGSATNLDDLWTGVLDHVFVVLRLVDI